MKGMLEICFPSLESGRSRRAEARTGKKSSQYGGYSRSLWRALSEATSKLCNITKGTSSVTRDEYVELLSYEKELKLSNPQWSQFSPTRVCLRLHGSWLSSPDLINEISRTFVSSFRKVRKRKDVPCEIVVPAEGVSALKGTKLDAEIVTLSDLQSESMRETWEESCEYVKAIQEEKILGLEFRGGEKGSERKLLRDQIQVTSLLRPKFVRIIHVSGEGANFFRLSQHDEMNQSLARGVALAIEAFEMLGYEPVALYPHALVLASCSKVDTEALRIPQRVMGIGVGAASYRVDAMGRTVTSRNSMLHDEYAKNVRSSWENRSLVKKAQTIPYLHHEIERSLVEGRGLCFETIKSEFGIDLEKVHPGLSRILSESGLAMRDNGTLKVSPPAKEYAGEVARNFFLAEQDLLRAA